MNKKPKNNINTEGINIIDKGINYVVLSPGTYKIDGQIINVDGYSKKEVGVKDFTDIRIVDANTFIEKYVCGTEYKSVENYEKEKEQLLSKRKCVYEDDEYADYEWQSLEDEYAYKKFIQLWKPINKTIQEISEPIEVEVKKVKSESGNKYITSCFLNGTDKDHTLFVYDRPSAVQGIVSECFTELGMVYQEGKSYGATENQKVWSNSTHSCIRYVTAFGTYIFGEGWDIRSSPKGKLEDLLAQYDNDKKTLRNIIITKYNQHFGKVDQGSFDFDGLLSKLNSVLSTLQKVDPKRSTYDEKRIGLNKLREAIALVESSYKVEGRED